MLWNGKDLGTPRTSLGRALIVGFSQGCMAQRLVGIRWPAFRGAHLFPESLHHEDPVVPVGAKRGASGTRLRRPFFFAE